MAQSSAIFPRSTTEIANSSQALAGTIEFLGTLVLRYALVLVLGWIGPAWAGSLPCQGPLVSFSSKTPFCWGPRYGPSARACISGTNDFRALP